MLTKGVPKQDAEAEGSITIAQNPVLVDSLLGSQETTGLLLPTARSGSP